MLEIALLPLDDRPVSYLLPKQIADFSGINLILPDRHFLGNINNSSSLEYLTNWCLELNNLSLIISLDNWVYGGLVQSRKHDLKLDNLKERIEIIRHRLISVKKYAFSSIMRIPNYNSDDEEKSYWKEYGEKLFKWSELSYRVGKGITEGLTNEELIDKWYKISQEIPKEIIADFKAHREINFSANMLWLELFKKHGLDFLMFSSDDSGKYGLNVLEAEYLKKKNALVISGTDEIPLLLFTKSILDEMNLKPSLSLFFSDEKAKRKIAKYESNTIEDSILNQINILNIPILENGDIDLIIHMSNTDQGDHIFKSHIPNTENSVIKVLKKIKATNKPYILLDVAYANGADPALVEILMKENINWHLCYGYAAWNTCSNSTGTALSMGINRWIAEKQNKFNLNKFKHALLTRFLDDYAYQAKIRHREIKLDNLKSSIKPYVETFTKILNIGTINIDFKFPWNRSFEIEIIIL